NVEGAARPPDLLVDALGVVTYRLAVTLHLCQAIEFRGDASLDILQGPDIAWIPDGLGAGDEGHTDEQRRVKVGVGRGILIVPEHDDVVRVANARKEARAGVRAGHHEHASLRVSILPSGV